MASSKTVKFDARVSPEFKSFVDDASDPSVVSCDDLNAAVAPCFEAAGLALQQVAAWRTSLTKAEIMPHDTALDGKFEHIHQTLVVCEREAQASMLAIRSLAKAFQQWDRYIKALPTDVANIFKSVDMAAELAASVEAGQSDVNA